MKIQTLVSLLFLSLSLSPLSLSLTQDGLYLLQAKSSLSDTADYLSDWNPRDPTPCNWTGIACGSPTGPVVSIDLSNLSLSGPFPLFLCRLPSLSSLSLGYNNLNSSLPSSISQCRTLTVLNLEENLLSGPIPDTLADIAGLRFLTLQANSFSGDIPASFGRFRQLQVLNLVNNFLNDSIPDSIGEITSLRELKLAYNPFPPSRLSPGLGNLSNLEHLWMSGCNLVGPIPDEFARLRRLRNLELSDNGLTGPIPGVIFEMKSIEQIELFNNSFSGEIPAEGWWRIPGLQRLDASANKLTGPIPNELCELPLGSLNLEDNQLTGPLPGGIAKSPNLYELKLFNNSLNGSLPSELGRNSSLVSIDVSTNQFSGELPQFLCEKGVLEQLLLIYNFFSGMFPEVYAKCQTLWRVRLRGNGFSGEFPSEFWGLPHVSLLDIGENLFSGNISHMIYGASNLSVLYISHNKFSGSIPGEIGFLNKLVELSASDNELSGPIPSTVSNLGLLGVLDLSNNQLSGKIPHGLESLKQLNELNLANNSLSGEIPYEIGGFPVLNYLDLSYNQFSGEIPLDLQNLKLNTLNLSYNRLTGVIPPSYANGAYDDSFLGNPGLCGDPPNHCNRKSKGINQNKAWILRSVLTAISLILLVGFLMFFWKYWKLMKSHKDTSIMKWRSFHKLDFSVTEIVNFLTEENVIGSGGSGKVYKAELNSGKVVAVKKLCTKEEDGRDEPVGNFNSEKDEFETEVETLGKIRHRSIVRLWCCCNAGDCKLLVYEYMPNGSLGDLLHSNKGRLLDWPTRFRIASDAADGLSYLHHDCVPPIVHRDVKSNNILLDEDFGARISDFGVAKVIKMVNRGAKSMSVIAGSCGYIAPEYAYTLRVTEKSDIYSFGVVILELLTGKRPIDPELGEKDLVTWVCNNLGQKGIDYILDQNIKYSLYEEQICKVLNIGILCVSVIPINRPSMRRVVKMLEEAGAAATATAVEKPVKCEREILNSKGSDKLGSPSLTK